MTSLHLQYRPVMVVSSTHDSDQESSSNSELRVQDCSNKVDEKCSKLPVGQSSSPPPATALVKRKRRNNCPGVRVVGSRIYDSLNGQSCHQCRQKTMDAMAVCKNHKETKQCSVKYCHKCMMNRYGEKVDEAADLEEWVCPRCRGICNCSFCRKKNGQQPAGTLVYSAKSTGFSSVSEMPLVNGSDVESVKNVMDHGDIVSKKRRNCRKLDFHGGKSKITMQYGQVETSSISSLSHVEVSLPQGSELRNVANIELKPEEVGHALQLLEFCATFEEILELRKDESKHILHELIRGGGGCIGQPSPVSEFIIRLLSLIQTDYGESSPVITHRLNHKTSWLLALHKCISTSTFLSRNLKLDKFDGGADSYDSLSSIERLTLVNYVCDEVLCTNKIRNWINEQKLKSTKGLKETKEKIVAAKQKEKILKKKMKDELTEALIAKNGVPLSISEHTTVVSQFKEQAAQAHTEMLESKRMLSSERQQCISVRTKPIFVDNEGHTFWKLKAGGFDDSNIILQETSPPDESKFHEKWLIYHEQEQIDHVKKYISFK